jgi:KipI family sensor histidine kinase inhibitor
MPRAAASYPGAMAEILPASDSSLLVRFGMDPDPNHHRAVLHLLRLWEQQPGSVFRSISPAAASVLFRFDPRRCTLAEAEAQLRAWLAIPPDLHAATRRVDIPVCYGGEFGPDLEEVARIAGLSAEEVIRRHSGREYAAWFLGFAPGFAYLGELDEQLVLPRRSRPRLRVEAGSVGIAGRQTAVYPLAMPGGWNLIGRSPLPMLSVQGPRCSRIHPGDSVRFLPISPDEFRQIQERSQPFLRQQEPAC